MEKFVVDSVLRAKETDYAGYTTYVFEVLDKEDPFYKHSKYVMTIRYPNWNVRTLNIGDEGYLEFIEVIAGEDKYWNGINFIPYNYSNWQFINFIEKPKLVNKEIIID